MFNGMLFQSHGSSSVIFPELWLYKVIPVLLAAIGLIALFGPNTFQISARVRRLVIDPSSHAFTKTAVPAVLVAFFLYFSIASLSQKQAAFLYYNF
jgi:hypothetical protein